MTFMTDPLLPFVYQLGGGNTHDQASVRGTRGDLHCWRTRESWHQGLGRRMAERRNCGSPLTFMHVTWVAYMRSQICYTNEAIYR